MAILEKNPNVGIKYRALAGGEIVRSGSYFGKDAADFLMGLNIAVSAGLLSSQMSASASNSNHAGATAQNSVTEDNPETLQAANNGKDCGVIVTFKPGTSNAATGLPNGPSTITYKCAPNFGLGFSVSGWVGSGGIGTIGVDRETGKKVQNPANPKGRSGRMAKHSSKQTHFPDLFLKTAGLTVLSRRYCAAFAIAYIGGVQARRALKSALPGETDPCVKKFLEVSLRAFYNREKPNHISSALNGKWLSAFYCR